MKRFNDWLATVLGNALSSMNFFYVCVVIDLVELPPVVQAHNVITWVTYISQSVIQLIALPILGAQNKLQSENHQETIRHIKKIHSHLGIKEKK